MAKDRFAPGIYRQEDRLYGSFVLFDLGVWREREREIDGQFWGLGFFFNSLLQIEVTIHTFCLLVVHFLLTFCPPQRQRYSNDGDDFLYLLLSFALIFAIPMMVDLATWFVVEIR